MRTRNNKKASSIVLLSIVFVSICIAVCGAIIVSRMIVVKSECEAYAALWTKAILSEYDVHLLEDYGIMAYFGNESEVQKRIDKYIEYSLSGKLDSKIGKSSAELRGYELGDINNFREALGKSNLNNISRSRLPRNTESADEEYKSRAIINNVVVDTLPSGNISSKFNTKSIVKKIKVSRKSEGLLNGINKKHKEYILINNCFGNHVTCADDKKSFFRNEWEYIIVGKLDDGANFKACKEYIFMIRNAMNLIYLNKDASKKSAIIAASELINPVAAPLIQAAITEAWAAAEAENDVKILLDNGRVPFIKTSKSWKTDLESILNSKSFLKKLDKESKDQLNINKEEIKKLGKGNSNAGNSNGQTYDDYLLTMMLAVNDNTRLLRCMDLVQINMKYRYYRDFNMMEYYVGVRFALKANGVSYEAENHYR